MKIRTYSDLSLIQSFEDRFRYLLLNGTVGQQTFGFDRVLNQHFYKSKEWKYIRDFVIIRDNGCDLGVDGYGINGVILIHHMNPLTQEDIIKQTDFLLNPEYLISTSHNTHNAIHYSDENLLISTPTERKKGDTRLW